MGAASDTPAEVMRVVIEGYRRMSARGKLERVVAMNRALDQLARTRLRAQYGGHMSEREMRLRLGALRLDPDVMAKVFGWDPRVRGL